MVLAALLGSVRSQRATRYMTYLILGANCSFRCGVHTRWRYLVAAALSSPFQIVLASSIVMSAVGTHGSHTCERSAALCRAHDAAARRMCAES